jgi:hypothetical protein
MLTHADFFAGLGVFSLAARELLIDTQLLCEWNDFCQTTLQKNFPGVPIHADIANFNPFPYDGAFDIITNGVPCPPFSRQGQRLATTDDRNRFPDFLRVIAGCRPRWIVVENVPGLLDAPTEPGGNPGSFFRELLRSLSQVGYVGEWLNPPYSCPGVWMAKLQAEVELGRVKEAIALVPAATDTNWLSPVLKLQPVCFWKGRIKFLDTNYQPKLPARQSHVLLYWGENWEKFREVFDPYGFVSVPNQSREDKLVKRISSFEETGDRESIEKTCVKNQSSRNTEKTSSSREDETYKQQAIDYNAGSTQFLEDKSVKNQSSRNTETPGELIDEEPDNQRASKEKHEFLEDTNYSSRKNRRNRGEGSGCIYYRTVIKKGKEYLEAYYQYELWSDGNAVVKSTKYIPKRLLAQVQQLDVEKAPVREILQVLGVVV